LADLNSEEDDLEEAPVELPSASLIKKEKSDKPMRFRFGNIGSESVSFSNVGSDYVTSRSDVSSTNTRDRSDDASSSSSRQSATAVQQAQQQQQQQAQHQQQQELQQQEVQQQQQDKSSGSGNVEQQQGFVSNQAHEERRAAKAQQAQQQQHQVQQQQQQQHQVQQQAQQHQEDTQRGAGNVSLTPVEDVDNSVPPDPMPPVYHPYLQSHFVPLYGQSAGYHDFLDPAAQQAIFYDTHSLSSSYAGRPPRSGDYNYGYIDEQGPEETTKPQAPSGKQQQGSFRDQGNQFNHQVPSGQGSRADHQSAASAAGAAGGEGADNGPVPPPGYAQNPKGSSGGGQSAMLNPAVHPYPMPAFGSHYIYPYILPGQYGYAPTAKSQYAFQRVPWSYPSYPSAGLGSYPTAGAYTANAPGSNVMPGYEDIQSPDQVAYNNYATTGGQRFFVPGEGAASPNVPQHRGGSQKTKSSSQNGAGSKGQTHSFSNAELGSGYKSQQSQQEYETYYNTGRFTGQLAYNMQQPQKTQHQQQPGQLG
jgi:hypothetical protein